MEKEKFEDIMKSLFEDLRIIKEIYNEYISSLPENKKDFYRKKFLSIYAIESLIGSHPPVVDNRDRIREESYIKALKKLISDEYFDSFIKFINANNNLFKTKENDIYILVNDIIGMMRFFPDLFKRRELLKHTVKYFKNSDPSYTITFFETFGILSPDLTISPENEKKIACYASSDRPILITGENGTGKEIYAEAIHYFSERGEQPFLAVNCAGLPDTLVESELFGHKKGAFTGAYNNHLGAFERAGKGTILLDEIGDMPLMSQGKLLRVLNNMRFQPLGDSSKERKVEARIICATNRDLKKMIRKGSFRQDLYQRINVLRIDLLPLREVIKDELIATVFFNQFLRNYGEKTSKLTNDVTPFVKKMSSYSWPGNYRELINVMERAFILLGDGQYLTADLIEFDEQPDFVTRKDIFSEDTSSMTFEQVEGKIAEYKKKLLAPKIKQLLSKHKGIIRDAAEEAGLLKELSEKYAIAKFNKMAEECGINYKLYRRKSS